MATFWKTRRRGWQRGSVLETGTTSHTSPQRDARLAKGIALGEVRPEDMCVADTDLPPTTILENRAKKPWDDIRSLLKAARERKKDRPKVVPQETTAFTAPEQSTSKHGCVPASSARIRQHKD